jgi:enolase
MVIIEQLKALEILDSRGNPTVHATCVLSDGTTAAASVPSGASTGAAEALELRDGDASRYRGLGCRKAVAVINDVLHPTLKGLDLTQDQLDDKRIALDGTPTKERRGANSLLAVSLAFARATARAEGLPLYRHFAHLIGELPRTLPRLTVNLFSGGFLPFRYSLI